MSVWRAVRGDEPRALITEPLAVGAAHVLAARADWEQRALSQNSISAQLPFDPSLALGCELTLTLENGEAATGTITYIEHLIKEGQAVTKVTLA